MRDRRSIPWVDYLQVEKELKDLKSDIEKLIEKWESGDTIMVRTCIRTLQALIEEDTAG